MMNDQKKDKDAKSGSATHEPWKNPGQSSQDPNSHPDPDVLEKEKNKKQDL